VPDPLEIPVEVDTDDAAADLKDFADDVEDLQDKFKPVELEVDTSDADSEIRDVADDLEKLGDAEIRPEIRPDIDTAHVDRAGNDIRDRLESKGAEAGSRFGGSFAADFGGVINEEVGQVGDSLVQGLGAALEGAGASASFAGPLIAALGIGTVVAAAAKTLWDKLNEGAEQYKKSLEEAATIQENLATGNLRAAVADIDKKLGPLSETMRRFGISTEEAGQFILGTTDNLAGLTDLADTEIWGKAAEQIKTYGGEQGDTANAIERTRDTLNTMRQANAEAGTSLQDTQRRMFELLKAAEGVTASTEDTTDAMLDLADETSGPTRDAILKHIGVLNAIPEEELTKILAMPDKEAVAYTQRYIQEHTPDETVTVRLEPDWGSWNRAKNDIIGAGIRIPVHATATQATAASVREYERRNGPVAG
jgi:hypothetical protein